MHLLILACVTFNRGVFVSVCGGYAVALFMQVKMLQHKQSYWNMSLRLTTKEITKLWLAVVVCEIFCFFLTAIILKHKTGIDLTVSPTLKKPSKNYTCFILRRFGLFLIHLQSKK